MAANLGGGLGRRRMSPTADINVTSLVDVAFVLLIIFMITAPIMQGGVEVQLPRTTAGPVSAKEGIVVTVDRQGRIFIDETPVTYDQFRGSFKALVARRNASSVYIRGDRRAAYGDVVRVLAVVRESGVQNVGLTTDDEEIGR
jgi:biopolymer transport protein ExbD/biopolymer transport protein TolR